MFTVYNLNGIDINFSKTCHLIFYNKNEINLKHLFILNRKAFLYTKNLQR